MKIIIIIILFYIKAYLNIEIIKKEYYNLSI